MHVATEKKLLIIEAVVINNNKDVLKCISHLFTTDLLNNEQNRCRNVHIYLDPQISRQFFPQSIKFLVFEKHQRYSLFLFKKQ